jgi:hypothetical protein
MSGSPARLYDEDFVRWTEEQAAALREAAGSAINLPLDWENLAEEIDSLGRSNRRELRSRIAVIIEHLIKLECSPAAEPRRSWTETVARERVMIEGLLEDSPSLKREIGGMIRRVLPRTIRLVTENMDLYDELSAETKAKLQNAKYRQSQILGRWFPASGQGPLPADGEREQRVRDA